MNCIPIEINSIKQYHLQKDIPALRQAAHNLKTSISIMGLTEKLNPLLDELEYKSLTETEFNDIFSSLETICNAALTEARQFYISLL